MTYAPLALPRLSARAATAVNGIYAGSRSLAFQAGGREWRFAPDAVPMPGTWRARLYIRAGDHDLAIFMENILPADWEDSGLSPHTLSALPPELAGAALELAFSDLAETFETAAGVPVVCSGINLEEEPAWAPEEGFLFTLTRDDGIRTRCALVAGDACLSLLAELLQAAAPAAERELASFPLSCRITCSGPELVHRELTDLEPGDVLLTEQNTADLHSPGLAVRLTAAKKCGAPARLCGARLHMEGHMTEEILASPDDAALAAKGSETENETVSPPTDITASVLDALPFQLSFDLGGIELSLAEAAVLAPGQILTTGRDAVSPVRILASGRAIGTGSLVDVAGRVGVRVETLSLK